MEKGNESIYQKKINIAIVIGRKEDILIGQIKENITGVMNRYEYEYQIAVFKDLQKWLLDEKEYDVLIWYMGAVNIGMMKRTSARIICIAESMDYVKDAFKARAYRYILLTNIEVELEEAMEDIADEIKCQQGIGITIGGVRHWILLKDIYYVEAFGDDAIVYATDRYFMVKGTMNCLQEQLGNGFFRCHRSYIVNLEYINRIEGQEVVIRDGKSIPVSFRRRKDLLEAYRKKVDLYALVE